MDLSSDWVVVEHQHQRVQKSTKTAAQITTPPSPTSNQFGSPTTTPSEIGPPAHTPPAELEPKQPTPLTPPHPQATKQRVQVIHSYFDPPLASANPFRKPAQQTQPTPQLETPPPSESTPTTPTPTQEHHDGTTKEALGIVRHLLSLMSCRGCGASPCTCVEADALKDELAQCLVKLAEIAHKDPNVVDRMHATSATNNFLGHTNQDLSMQPNTPPKPTPPLPIATARTPPPQASASASPDQTTNTLAHSIVLVSEEHKHAVPTNLDSVFRPENISRVSGLFNTLVSSASRTRDKLNTKSSAMLRALPQSQGLHVILGLLVLYYALPSATGMVVVRRIFDVVVVRNVLFSSSWDVLSQFLEDDTAGHRSCVVAL